MSDITLDYWGHGAHLMRLLPKISDYRALAGAVSLVLVGIHLSVMSGLYFLMDRQSFEVFHTGWWWEIALNLQIVCYFLMYLCHRERMQGTVRWRRMRARYRFLIAMLGVSVPSFLLVIAARRDWFETPPVQQEVIHFISTAFSLWVLTAYIIPSCMSLFMKNKRLVYMSVGHADFKGMIFYFMPLIILLLIAGIEQLRGGNIHLILWPFFAYLQGGLVYFWAAFNAQGEGKKGLVADEIQLAEGD